MKETLRNLKEKYGVTGRLYSVGGKTYCDLTMPSGETLTLGVYGRHPDEQNEREVAQQERRFVRTLDKLLTTR